MEFYEDKIKTVGANLEELEKIITQKTQNVKVVEDGKSYNPFIPDMETKSRDRERC